MWILLNILIITTAVLVIPINILDQFWLPKESIFTILGFCIIASSWMNNYPKTLTFKNKWLGLILIYTIISLAWHFYVPLIFNNMIFNDTQLKFVCKLWVIRPTISLILSLFLIQTLVEYTDSLERWVKLAKVLCWVAFGFSVYAILQYFNFDQIFGNYGKFYINDVPQGKIRMMSLIGQHTLTANFLAMLSPLCLIFKKLKYRLFYLTIFIAIILADSALSVAAFVVGFLAYLALTKQFKWLLATFLLAITGLILFRKHQFFSFSGRLEIWKDAFPLIKSRLFTGCGLGSFGIQNIIIGGKRALSAHCEPLQILVEGGLILMTLVSGYLSGLFKKIFFTENTILKIGYTCGFLSFLVVCLGSFPLRIAPLFLVGILYISGLEVLTIKGE